MKIWKPLKSPKFSAIFNYDSFAPFLMGDSWDFVNYPEMAEVIPVLAKTPGKDLDQQIEILKSFVNKKQTLLLLNLFHIDDHMDSLRWFEHQKEYYSPVTNRIIILHTNLANRDYECYVDFLWNREKKYFTDYNTKLKGRHWTYYSTGKMFELADIKKNYTGIRFLSPTRIYNVEHKRMSFRKLLLKNLNSADSITSAQQPILPEEYNSLIEGEMTSHKSIWFPCANKIYNDTLISVYIETITEGFAHRSITEKTFDPLIKGHFILPFSYSGIIKDLKTYGFKFPDFIDYSYDNEADLDKRWECYLRSLYKLKEFDYDTLYKLCEQNIDIIKHNRQIFYTRPYSYFKERLQTLITKM